MGRRGRRGLQSVHVVPCCVRLIFPNVCAIVLRFLPTLTGPRSYEKVYDHDSSISSRTCALPSLLTERVDHYTDSRDTITQATLVCSLYPGLITKSVANALQPLFVLQSVSVSQPHPFSSSSQLYSFTPELRFLKFSLAVHVCNPSNS